MKKDYYQPITDIKRLETGKLLVDSEILTIYADGNKGTGIFQDEEGANSDAMTKQTIWSYME